MYPDVENNVDSSSTWINDDDNYVLVSSGGTHQTFVHLDEAQEIVDSRDDEDPYAGPHITQDCLQNSLISGVDESDTRQFAELTMPPLEFSLSPNDSVPSLESSTSSISDRYNLPLSSHNFGMACAADFSKAREELSCVSPTIYSSDHISHDETEFMPYLPGAMDPTILEMQSSAIEPLATCVSNDTKMSRSRQNSLRTCISDADCGKLFPCPVCGARYKRRDTLARHRMKHGREPHVCKFCPKSEKTRTFTRKDHLTQHHRKCHADQFPEVSRRANCAKGDALDKFVHLLKAKLEENAEVMNTLVENDDGNMSHELANSLVGLASKECVDRKR